MRDNLKRASLPSSTQPCTLKVERFYGRSRYASSLSSLGELFLFTMAHWSNFTRASERFAALDRYISQVITRIEQPYGDTPPVLEYVLDEESASWRSA